MEALWALGPCSVREILESFPVKKRPAYTTVQTTVYRLEVKKALRRIKKISTALIFEAAVSRNVAKRRLIVHRETKEPPVYALSIGKKGPKIKKSDGSKEARLMFHASVQADGSKVIQLIVENGSMQELADLYAKFMGRPVIDRTGLKDRYDFTMDYEANTDAPGPFTELSGPGLFKAFDEQVGIKWEATKGPVEVLVIDRAEKPSAN
jgi:uncharacterized protein (TIGR03435 family)